MSWTRLYLESFNEAPAKGGGESLDVPKEVREWLLQ